MKKVSITNNEHNEIYIRSFYNKLYRQDQIRNPAVKIYDQLRINAIQFFAKNAGPRVLIVGCGSNLDHDLFLDNNLVYYFDISFIAVKSVYYNGIKAFTADALSIPLPSHSFDLIVCSEVLEHIPEVSTAVSEFARLLTSSGTLIVSSPNWFSWFGKARLIGEFLRRKPFHSSDQPYDDWKTIWKFKKELAPWFEIIDKRGVWYLPPLHYRNRGISEKCMNRIYTFYKPIETLLSKKIPYLGHLLVLKCQLRQ